MPAVSTSLDRRVETGLVLWTVLAVAVYVPVETATSWPHLGSPGYLCDAIAMVLLAVGARRSWTARPRSGIAPLAAGWGWASSLAWRTYFERVHSRTRGLGVYDEPRWVESALGWVLVLSLVAFAVALSLALRSVRRADAPRAGAG